MDGSGDPRESPLPVHTNWVVACYEQALSTLTTSRRSLLVAARCCLGKKMWPASVSWSKPTLALRKGESTVVFPVWAKDVLSMPSSPCIWCHFAPHG